MTDVFIGSITGREILGPILTLHQSSQSKIKLTMRITPGDTGSQC